MVVARCESLERRSLLAATLGPGGALTVHGTSAADLIGIRVVTTELRVDINGTLSKFSLASVNSISIDLFEGNDRLDLADVPLGIYCLGGLGDDSINASIGNDTITAGGGKDSVNGGAGDDRIDGGPTADRANGQDGADRIYGGDANDILWGEAGVDRLFAGNGNDQLIGGSSNDKLYGDAGNDSLWGDKQNDLLTGGDGDDYILGGAGNDTLNGQLGDDTMWADADNDFAYGDQGDDWIDGGAGNDNLTAGDDDDSVYASDGADTVTGGLGHDSLEGGYGTDSLDGGDGDDTVSGGFGRDQVIGGNGTDALLGGRDEDTLRGNDGPDRFLLRPNDVTPDQTPIDGRVLFKDGTVSWEDSEILLLDAGLKWLQSRTGSTKMMRMSNGEEFEVVRYGSLSGGDTLADNDSEGTIRVATNTFDYSDTDIAATMIHEIAHNWDKEDENHGVEDNFYELSRWRERFNVWTHASDAEFAREYGETNPYEDFATCLEVYFDESNPARNWQTKWNYIDGWLDSIS